MPHVLTTSSSTLLLPAATSRLFLLHFSFLSFFLLLPSSSMGERPVRLPPELEDVPPRPLEVREKEKKERAAREGNR